ncbi:MAG: preprotein translocase subunit SecG [Oscillospiraceae bacterium]|nr:preprotein translocase subunit SecG [Oscillospiraceae bacterium]
MTIFLTILQVLSGVVITTIVLAQSGKSAGLSGAIAGAADSFLAKNKAKTVDAQLAKITKWFALAFIVLTIILNMMAK